MRLMRFVGLIIVKVSYPLKQGLKLHTNDHTLNHPCVKVSYPLKQGLKHILILVFHCFLLIVKVSYPLKQGLKQFNAMYLCPSSVG